MKKHDFLEELLRRLSSLPQAEREKAYAFYAEIIDDSMEDGMTEEEAVASLGSMDENVERIVADTPMATLVKSRVGRRPRTAGVVLLLVLGFPVWFPVLISLASVLFTLFIVFWILALTLWIVLASCAAAVVGGFAGLMLVPEFGTRLMGFGIAIASAGFAVLLYPACVQVTRLFARFTRRLWMNGKRALMKKGEISYETES